MRNEKWEMRNNCTLHIAHLKRTDAEIDDLKLVARALLPAEIVVGSQLKYEMMQYEII